MKLLIMILIFSQCHFAKAEFSQLNLKYLSNYDLEIKLGLYFKNVWSKNNSNSLANECFNEKYSLGFNNSATGEPQSLIPTSGFVQKLQNCVNKSFAYTFSESYFVLLNKAEVIETYKVFYGELLNEELNNSTDIKSFMNKENFKSLNSRVNNKLVDSLMLNILGVDEVILSYGLIKNIDEYKLFLNNLINDYDTLLTGSIKIINQLYIRDEFLTY